MVDTLERMNIGALFTIGGDGTLRGARAISEEVGRMTIRQEEEKKSGGEHILFRRLRIAKKRGQPNETTPE